MENQAQNTTTEEYDEEQIPTVFSVTTENFIGTIKDAPPPIEIPFTRATCDSTKTWVANIDCIIDLGKTTGNIDFSPHCGRLELLQMVPGFSYRYEYDDKANTSYRPLQGKSPLPK